MESVFKMMLVRPPKRINQLAKIDFSTINTTFLHNLEGLKKRKASLEAIKEKTNEFIESEDFCNDINKLNFAEQLKLFKKYLQNVDNFDKSKLDYTFNRIFHDTPENIAKSSKFIKDEERLQQTIVATKVLSTDEYENFNELVDLLRIVNLIKEYKNIDAGNLFHLMNAKIKLSQNIFPLKSSLSNLVKEDTDKKDKKNQKAKELYDRYNTVSEALDELSFIKPKDFVSSPINVFKTVESKEIEIKSPINSSSFALRMVPYRISSISHDTSSNIEKIKILLPGSTEFDPKQLENIGFKLKKEAEESMSSKTRAFLKTKGLKLSEDSIEKIQNTLEEERENLYSYLDSISEQNKPFVMKKVGPVMVIETEVKNNVFDSFPWLFTPAVSDKGKIPFTHGSVKPSGIAELLIIKQQLKRYEGGDIAHIENVLKGESKSKEHNTIHKTESFFAAETESTTSHESSISTSDRFEMSRAVVDVIRDETSSQIGMSIKGKYGPAVEVGASAGTTWLDSHDNTTQHAENFARSITQSSVEKITQRVLKKESLKVIDTIEDINKHTLDNTSATEHTIGIYQWVNKVYEAQLYNYGERVMYDFMIPEPAAFTIEALKLKYSTDFNSIKEPESFNIHPRKILLNNYQNYVKKYDVTGVEPPPQPYITKSKSFSQSNIDMHKEVVVSEVMKIDEGYEAVSAVISFAGAFWTDWWSDVLIGQRKARFSSKSSWQKMELDNERGELPLSIHTALTNSFIFNIEVLCRRNNQAIAIWQMKTHEAILKAYKNKVSEYEEKIALLKAQAGIEISGTNPVTNQVTIENELKKHAITLMSNQHFDMFGSIENGTNGLPQINVDESIAEGKYVRFFEQAFEWENMTYLFYPYFWSRKDTWIEKLHYEDVDPLFADFIKAGSSRVNVPVREGFEGAVDHFMQTGEVWDGGKLPTVSSELYISIAQELSENLGRPGAEVPVGEPWEVKIPTTLVKLRSDNQLPKWKKDDNGNWIEDED